MTCAAAARLVQQSSPSIDASFSLLGGWDWAVLVWTLAVTTGVGLVYARRAGRGIDEYFLSGRSLPWWALGTSIVATTFAADTPIVVSAWVVGGGIAKNWLWWSFLVGGTMTVFLFSRWWRRAAVFTEVELIALRYDGAAASLLRAFKAVYLGLFVNAIVIAFVTRAMASVVERVLPGVEPEITLAVLLAVTFGYAMASGLWGVVATDVLQFSLAMVGAIVLAAVAVNDAGGLSSMLERVRAVEVETGRDILSMFPSAWDAFTASIVVLMLVNWWAVYYPGSEPGGGGFAAQRMLAAKDENHARGGMLWFIVAHFAVRPWPWILVGLAAIALHPEFATVGEGEWDPNGAYPAMFARLPAGMLGVVCASFVAAFMSTITSQLNLAASFLVRDLWQPFLSPEGEDGGRGDVLVGRIAVFVVLLVATGVYFALGSAGEGWQLLMDVTAGTGLVLILRWLWWRVNAWSEISALASSAFTFLLLRTPPGHDLLVALAGGDAGSPMVDRWRLLLVVAVSTAVWLPVTFATRPVGAEHLGRFFTRVRPGGAWAPVATATGVAAQPLRRDLWLWALSTAAIACVLFGVGTWLLHGPSTGVPTCAAAVVLFALVGWGMRAGD
jgi:SSS family solute:Na+ symporter